MPHPGAPEPPPWSTQHLRLDGNGEVVCRTVAGPADAPTDAWLYDAGGRLLAHKAHGLALQTWAYSGGAPDQMSMGGLVTDWSYAGDTVTLTHPRGIIEETVHGGLGVPVTREVRVDGFLEQATEHDHLGRVIGRTTPGGDWAYEHGPFGLTEVQDPSLQVFSYTWRSDGQLLGVQAPAGPNREYEYDGLGRPTRAQVMGPNLVQDLQVTWVGNVPTYQQKDIDGLNLDVTRTAYADGRGRPAYTTWSRDAARPAGDLLTREVRYDAGDRPLRVWETRHGAPAAESLYTWDAAGRLNSATEAGAVIDYAYTANSATISPPWGATPLTRTFDDLGRLTSVARAGVTHTLTWDDGNRLLTVNGGGLSQTRAYAGPGKRLSSISFSEGANPLGSLTYAWNPDQARGGLAEAPWLALTDTVAGANRVTEHWLDPAERLSRVIQPGANGRRQHDYTWRADGARESETITLVDEPTACEDNEDCAVGEVCVAAECLGEEQKIVHAFNGLGQLLAIDRSTRQRGQAWPQQPNEHTDVESDGWGRITSYQTDGFVRQMTWDVEGRLLSMHVGGVGGNDYSYRYNWRDQRTHRSGPEGTVTSAWETDGLLAEVFDDGNDEVARVHLRGAGMTLGVDGTAFGLDHLGSPVMRWADDAGTPQRFDAWGAHLGGGAPGFGAESVGYTSHAFDGESGLTYAQARYYDPKIGAFLGPDPWDGSLESPGTLQKYAYVLGNPVLYTDPDGRSPECGAESSGGEEGLDCLVVPERSVGNNDWGTLDTLLDAPRKAGLAAIRGNIPPRSEDASSPLWAVDPLGRNPDCAIGPDSTSCVGITMLCSDCSETVNDMRMRMRVREIVSQTLESVYQVDDGTDGRHLGRLALRAGILDDPLPVTHAEANVAHEKMKDWHRWSLINKGHRWYWSSEEIFELTAATRARRFLNGLLIAKENLVLKAGAALSYHPPDRFYEELKLISHTHRRKFFKDETPEPAAPADFGSAYYFRAGAYSRDLYSYKFDPNSELLQEEEVGHLTTFERYMKAHCSEAQQIPWLACDAFPRQTGGD